MSPSNIREKLESEGYKILSTDSSDQQKDYSDWNSIISKWKEDGNKLSTFAGGQTDEADVNKKISSLRTKCKKVLKSSIEDRKYEKAKIYCAVTTTPKTLAK